MDEDGYLAYFCKAGDGVVDVQLIGMCVFVVAHSRFVLLRVIRKLGCCGYHLGRRI